MYFMNKKETDYQSAVSFDENYLWSFHSKIGQYQRGIFCVERPYSH